MQGTCADAVGRTPLLSSDYLSLRTVSLKPSEEWAQPRKGLSFVFPTRGAGRFISDSESHALAPGEAEVLNWQPGNRLYASDQSRLNFSVFTVSFPDLYPLFAGHELHLVPDVEERFKQAGWRKAPKEVAKECHRLLETVPGRLGLEHRSHLLRIAAAILESELAQLRPAAGGFVRMEDHVCQVLERLSLEDLLSLSVGDLAVRFSCSKRHLNRVFHEYFGLSVASLRMELRLLKAISLLRNPVAKVINVAEQCGFNHLGLFGTCFKRRFGVSPSQWRDQASEPAPAPPGLVKEMPACQIADNGLCPWHCRPDDGRPLIPLVNQRQTSGKCLSQFTKRNGAKQSVLRPRVKVSPSRLNLEIKVGI